MIGKTVAELTEGDHAELARVVADDDIAGLISAVIGTTLPGPGAIYLSQSLKFMKPVSTPCA